MVIPDVTIYKYLNYAAFFVYALIEYLMGKNKFGSILNFLLLLVIGVVKFTYQKLFNRREKNGPSECEPK